MKIIVSLFFMFLSYNIFAQPFGDPTEGYRIVRLDYENSSGEKGYTLFKYDLDGKMIKGFWSLDDQSRSSVNLYEHDAKGNIISSFREFSDGIISYELFEYDIFGKKRSELFFRSDSVRGSAEYFYLNGIPEKVVCKKHKGWIEGEIVYKYNSEKRKESAILYRENEKICSIKYSYDKAHNLEKEIWDFGGKWSQIFSYIYEKIGVRKRYYSIPYLSGNSDYRIKEESYSFNDEVGGPSYYYYDEKGLLARKKFVRSDSLVTITDYEYDSRDRLIKSIRKYSDGKIGRFTYEYDEKNNLILRRLFHGDSLKSFEAYHYDSEGTLNEAYVKNLDNWLTGRIIFQAEERGRVVTGEFHGEDGFDADIIMDYDKQGNLVEIIWRFSFGKYQKYLFEYE